MKRTLLLTMTMLMLLTVSALAYEIDMSYTGAIDIFNGQPIDESADTADTDIVVFDESSYFDRRDGMFVYRVSGAGNEIRCSVADGMMTSDHVRVEVSEGMDCTIYLDGEQTDVFDLSDLSEAGSYAVTAGPSAQDKLPHIRFHELRHSCASLLLNSGFTLKDVQEWMGHADIKMTADIYGHLDAARKQSMASKLSGTLFT